MLLAACGGGAPEMLAARACQEERLPEAFERLTFGNLSRSDLGREAGAQTLARAGVEGSYFAYWKERIDDPGADVALELVCQVTAFGEAAEAVRFAAALRADRGSLSLTVAGVTIAEGTAIREIPPPPRPEGMRAFRLEERGGLVRYAVVVARGRFSLSVHLGGREERATLAEAAAILETMAR